MIIWGIYRYVEENNEKNNEENNSNDKEKEKGNKYH